LRRAARDHGRPVGSREVAAGWRFDATAAAHSDSLAGSKDGAPIVEQDSRMTSSPFARARLLAAALALVLLPGIAPAQEIERGPDASTNPTAHAWKLAYARRLAQEGMERKEA